MPISWTGFEPDNLRKCWRDDSGNLKPSCTTAQYLGASPLSPGDIKSSIVDPAGFLKAGLTLGDSLKPSMMPPEGQPANLIVNPNLGGGADSGPTPGNNPPTNWSIGFNTANSFPMDQGGFFMWDQNPEAALARCYLTYEIHTNNPSLLVGETYEFSITAQIYGDGKPVLGSSGLSGVTQSFLNGSLGNDETNRLSLNLTIDAPGWTASIRAGVGITSNRDSRVRLWRPRLRLVS